MTDPAIQPAAHEDAKVDARSAAKWLIASFAAVGAVLLSGLGLSGLGDLAGVDLAIALIAVSVAILSVVLAVILIADVLTPTPVTLKDLADVERARDKAGAEKDAESDLVQYIESNPSFFQGIGVDAKQGERLIALDTAYRDALDERFRTSEQYWRLTQEEDPDPKEAKRAGTELDVADARADTIHETVRRLERIASAQQTVQKLRRRRTTLAFLALVVAASIAAFALASGSSEPAKQPTYAADIENVDLRGANLEGADLEGTLIRNANFEGAQLQGAAVEGSIWVDTTCPDGSDSDTWNSSCAGHLDPLPVRRPKPLP